jgi:hypothetical protein
MPYSVIQQGKYSLKELNDILKTFCGHHYFHNFFTGNTPKARPKVDCTYNYFDVIKKPKTQEEPDEDSENEEERDLEDEDAVPKEPRYLASREEQLANWKQVQTQILQRTVQQFTVTDPFITKTASGKDQQWVKFIIKVFYGCM